MHKECKPRHTAVLGMRVSKRYSHTFNSKVVVS